MTWPDDAFRDARPERPPMPDHVRRAIDARLGDAAWQEAHSTHRASVNDSVDLRGETWVAQLDDYRAPDPKRRFPVVMATVALIAGLVGVLAVGLDRSADPDPATETAAAPPVAAPTLRPATVEPTTAIDPALQAILDDVPTDGLDNQRLQAIRALAASRSMNSVGEQRQAAGDVVIAVACAWVQQWHAESVTGDIGAIERALAALAELRSWGPLDQSVPGAVARAVDRAAAVIADAGVGPDDVDATLAEAGVWVCDA